MFNFRRMWLRVVGQPLKSLGLFPAASLVIGWGPKRPVTTGKINIIVGSSSADD